MATIHRRGTRWRAQVRRRGLPPLSKTFGKHEDAARWAQTVEGRLAVGDVLDLGEARRTTLGEALERYLVEVTPLKKGAKQERVRIQAWLRDPLARRALASIRSMEIAAWRNERVAAGKAPTTVRNALTIISQNCVADYRKRLEKSLLDAFDDKTRSESVALLRSQERRLVALRGGAKKKGSGSKSRGSRRPQ